jgi:hypothetical protein
MLARATFKSGENALPSSQGSEASGKELLHWGGEVTQSS